MDSSVKDFEWLADLHKSQCFTTCELSNPAKSSDFGADGYTASLTDWHELLQLTAPDNTCGIVFVRGQFPNTPGAILARAQRRDDTGSKGTFGTRLQRAELDSDLELGERIAQGWVNLRWPYTQYELKRKNDQWDEHTGTYEEISFVRDETVFQIARVKWGHGSSLSDYSDSTDGQEKQTIKFKTGGVVQFGCPCSNGGPPDADMFTLDSGDHSRTLLSCTSARYQKRFSMQMFINGTRQATRSPLHDLGNEEVRGKEVDTSAMHRIELAVGDPTYIVSTYTLRNANDPRISVDLKSFNDLDDHLGISNTSVHMTDRLWTALCSTNYEASEAVEICVIGRCVEQIMCVAAVPFRQGVGMSAKNKEFSATAEGKDSNDPSEIALLCNIIASQHVDVQSAFFQVRTLVKVYNFINTRHFEPDLLQGFQSLDDIRVVYLEKLRRFIRSSLVWLINTDMKPGRLLLALKSSDDPPDVESQPSERIQQCERNRVRMVIDQSYNQACFATLAVWYVMKYCPDAVAGDFVTEVLFPKLTRAFESVQKRSSRDKEPTPKNDVLQWLHLCCLFLICNGKIGINKKGDTIDGFMASGLDRQDLIKTQQRFEKYVARLKTSQVMSYSVEHEELDRVILVGEELGLDAIPTQFTSSLASSRALQTRKQIAERKRTTTFSPGPKSWKGARVTSNGPWELLCTNHQSFVRVADDSSIRAARDRMFEFMMSDYSFMTSWDRADSTMIGKWWDIEPCSVVCATLIDLKVESNADFFTGKLRSAMSEKAVEDLNLSFHDLHESPVTPGGTLLSTEEPPKSIRDILIQMKQMQEESSREHLSQMRQLLVQEDMGANLSVKVFDWMMCKPGKLFHPEWWIQSLNDTPEVYEAKQTKNVPLRKEVKRYLKSRGRRDIIYDSGYTLSNIREKIAAADLQFLSIFDLYLTPRFTIVSKDTSITTLHPAQRRNDAVNDQRNTVTSPQRTPVVKQSSTAYSSNDLEVHRNLMLDKLNDSLVDLGAKHRILFAEKCSPSLVGSFIYMWHPDSLDTIDSYFGATSRFAEIREITMWTTSITLSHWSIRPTSLSPEHVKRFKENRNNGDFPPTSIASLGFENKESKQSDAAPPTAIVEERSSSLVITGDPSGHLWICSIWSSLTNSEEILPPVHSLPAILQRFIHQQACGRCLVFLVLLGHLCEKLAGEYEMILSRLDIIVGLGERVLLEGLDWGTTEAVDKLKKMLWGLEALRVFDDRLSGSLSQIRKAQEAMERTIKQFKEAGQQHVDLLQEYNNVIEEFEKRFGMLSDVQIRTQLKIRQVTGLRDGISTVTNVEDSQIALRDSKTTIRQGNNIRILTYITIAYLPLGFVTGLFSISHAPFMDSAGNVAFAILVILFVLGTYTLALSLENIIDQWARLRDEKWGVKGLTTNPPRRDGETKLSFNMLGSCCGLRRRPGGDESEGKISDVA